MTFTNRGNETESAQVGSAPGQEQQTTTEPGYVTADQLDALKKELDSKLSNLYRGVQSQTDKLSYKVQQRVEAIERAAQAQGMTLTASQRQQLTDQTTLEELRAATGSSYANQDQGEQTGETDDEFTRSVNQAAETMIKISGITFDANDPETKLINDAAENGTAEQYLDAHREAIRLKKERLAKTGQETPQRSPLSAVPGAIPGSINPNSIANVKDLDGLWEAAKKKGKV